MKIILLSKGETSLVDDEDFAYLSKHKWYLSNGYAINEDRVKMHRMILKPLPDQLVDHRDHNKLNNQKYNIRIVNKEQNVHNQHKRRNTNNTYKGVQFKKKLGLYNSRCRINHEDHDLGFYKSEIAAAYAYNKKAKELSEYALLNELNYSIDELEEMLSNDRSSPCAERRSGIKGIYWNKNKKVWESYLRINGRHTYIKGSKELSIVIEAQFNFSQALLVS